MAKTMEQSGSPSVVVDRELIESSAFLSLTGKAPQVLMLFLRKRRMKKSNTRRQTWIITNNGDIEFTYTEAERRWSLSRSQFQRALRQLCDCGFIDIAFRGTGHHGSSNRYSVSARWREWGTDQFVQANPPKKNNFRGFKKGHALFVKRPHLTLLTGTHGRL